MAGGATSSTAPTNKARDVMPRAIKFRLGLAGDNSPEACGYARILCTFCIIICESHPIMAGDVANRLWKSFQSRRAQFVRFSARYAVPTVYYSREFVAVGGLLSYGASFIGMYRQAGNYVGRRPPKRSASLCRRRCLPPPTK